MMAILHPKEILSQPSRAPPRGVRNDRCRRETKLARAQGCLRRVFVRNLGVAPLDYRKSFRSAYDDPGKARMPSRRPDEADARPHQCGAGFSYRFASPA
jgi:hypothetical protein